MTVWAILWIGWIIAFAIVETVAVANDKKNDTLSEHLRLWFRVDTRIGRTIFLCLFAAFAVWFGVHILTSLV